MFRRNVIDRFVDDYAAGRTPNPCVSCNNFVKLGTLRSTPTGSAHTTLRPATTRASNDAPTARTFSAVRSQRIKPTRSRNSRRSSSHGCCSRSASSTKHATRAHARRLGLPVHDKPESQDICFVEGGDYRDVLARFRPEIDVRRCGRRDDRRADRRARRHRELYRRPARAAAGKRRRRRGTSPASTRRRTRSSSGAKTSCLRTVLKPTKSISIRPERFGAGDAPCSR